MATKPDNEAEKDMEDDFVVLQTFDNMTDSGMSNASTIPEKQTFESQEKLSENSGALLTDEKPTHDSSSSSGAGSNTDSYSSLGDSMINILPYFESSQFIDRQLEMEKKLGVLGEGDGREKGDEIEKGDEKDGSASGSGKGEECKGDNVGKKSEGQISSDIGGGEGMGDDKGSGEQVKDVSGSGKGEKVKDVKVMGSGEGRARGGKRGGEMHRGGGDVESSWIDVEGEAGSSGVGNLKASIGGGTQKEGGITTLPGNMVKEQKNTSTEDMDGESVSGVDTKLVEGRKEEGEINKGEDGEHETKVDDKFEIDVDDSQTSHVEDIPSEEQACQEHSSAEDEVSVDDSKQLKNDSSLQVGENSESLVGLVDSLGDQDSENMEGVADEDSTDADGGHAMPPSSQTDAEEGHTMPSSSQTDAEEGHTMFPFSQIDTEGGLATSPSSQTEQSQNEHVNEDSTQPDDGTYSCTGFDYTQGNQAGQPFQVPNPRYQEPPRQQAQQAYQQAPNELQPRRPDDERAPERAPQRNPPIVPNQRAVCCSWLFLAAFVGIVSIGFVFIAPHIPTINFWLNKGSLPKPIIEMKTKTHVSPSASSLTLAAECRAYNTSYTIQHCFWRQIHPLATSPGNTVLPDGTKDCRLTTSTNHPPTHSVDATLEGLKVPTDRGTYTFELVCGHEAGNSATKRVEIWVNELNPPIISVEEPKVIVCTSRGMAELNVSCRAVQGRIVERKWEYIDGPPEVTSITPSENGLLLISQPGIYKFKYRCIDSFGGTALSRVITVHAKPPYVLGIDLGTSTTCIAIIKEDGTRQDIGIYVDESDLDPCIPSYVAFAENGELLVGEKALRQAVINPHSTIYEVKRLMGRSYYDDPDHKFVYRVRPTLKSHSLKGVRAAVEIPCGKTRKKLVQPELVSALILRHVADHAQRYLRVLVKDVVISVPAQFDDAQRKATMDAGLIAGLNPVKIVNEPTVAAFAANSLTEKLLAANDEVDTSEEEKQLNTVWAVVADIGGGTTDYALMQIQGSYYKVITTDGDKTLGGRDIDIRLTEVMTQILEDKYLGHDLNSPDFQQKLRIECENAKIVLSEKHQYSLTVEYVNQDEHTDSFPLEYLLTRVEFEEYVAGILKAMIKPLDSLLARAGGSIREAFGQGVDASNVEDLYLVGGTSNIPKLKELLLSYFSNVKNVRHEDPVQLVSRGAAAFGAALTGLVEVGKMPRIDAVPLPISIAVDMDDMHVIFERNRLYPCIEKRVLTTYTNNQNAIVIKVYEGEGRTADECHFLGEFELSGIPPLRKNEPEIQATFKIDTNGILSVKASYGDVVKGMKLDVYSKSGGMISKTRDKMHLTLGQLQAPRSVGEAKCDFLEDATPMSVIPVKPSKSNVLKLSVDSEYDSVKMVDSSNPNAMVPAIGMVTVKGLVTDYDSVTKGTDLDIVLVVDLSGSMAGIPIATMKTVILHLIDSLKENHRLGIVTYATNVFRNLELVSCTAENKNRARGIVGNFGTMGSTNLYGGLLNGLQMAYNGGRRSRVLLFTDGHANDGAWIENNDIIREIVRETSVLQSRTQAQVSLSTFGYLEEHDEFLLQQLATHVGGGTYNFLNENTALASTFAKVLGDAIHTIAEKIELSITPLDKVQVVEAITNFKSRQESEKLIFEIPSTADQQSRHILLQLAVPPTSKPSVHEGLYRVELTYTNTLTEREEGSEEYLYVGRTEILDVETRSRDVDEQMNRVFVARQIDLALKAGNREKSVEFLKQAYDKIQASDSKSHTLSVCLSEDLESLIRELEQGDLNTARKSLQDSLTSHWQEKGGRRSCYVTRKEDKLISLFTS